MASSQQSRVTSSLQVTSGKLNYQSQPSAFIAVVNGSNGPTPGSVTIPVNGTDVTFPQLTAMGGFCRLMNLDPVNYVTVGVRDKSTNEFYPLLELLPGETYVCRLSRKLPMEEAGTGTFLGSNTVLHAKADTANIILLVEAFDP